EPGADREAAAMVHRMFDGAATEGHGRAELAQDAEGVGRAERHQRRNTVVIEPPHQVFGTDPETARRTTHLAGRAARLSPTARRRGIGHQRGRKSRTRGLRRSTGYGN